MPTFAKPKLSIEFNGKLRKDIASLIIKAELKNKHRLKNTLKEELRVRSQEIRNSTSFLLFHALRYRVRSVVDSKRKKWSATHQRKLEKLRGPSTTKGNPAQKKTIPNIIHNFSSYVLSDKETEVLSYSLDHYIPGSEYGKRTQVEFERFFQEIVPYTDHLPAHDKTALKTKFLDTFNKYSKIKIPSEERKILESLYKNKDITVLRQDKGRGVVVMNKCDYIEKSSLFLNGSEFEKLDSDLTASFQTRVQNKLLSMKKRFTDSQYKRLYPSSSRPGLFFGLAKVHKLQNGSTNVNELPLRPVISNIGTTTYELSKYLAKLLQPIAKSEFTIESTKDFVQKIKRKKIEKEFEMISFDVVSLFTSVPLDFTIGIILDKIYNQKLIATKLTRDEMKSLLEICTKEMHFSFDGSIYRQVNGVAMGSPLGPVIANIFMVELEKRLIPTMSEKISLWFRYVDDTFTFIKKGQVDSVVEVLNGFHEKIKFTFEKEVDGCISFLDVKVIKKSDDSFDTDIYRKKTDTNVYLSWKGFAPRPWKLGTLKGLIRRAFTVCSTDEYREKEVSFLKKVFTQMNGFPSKVVSKVIKDVRDKMADEIVHNPVSDPVPIPSIPNMAPLESVAVDAQSSKDVCTPYICLPYKGLPGEEIVRKFKDVLVKSLPNYVQPRIIYKGTKLGSCFRVKDKVPMKHESNLVYAFKKEGVTNYIGETKVRYGTRTYEHMNTDKASAVYKHKIENRLALSDSDFEIIDKGFPKTVDRKLAEALYVKELDPILNRQKSSYKLHLFN